MDKPEETVLPKLAGHVYWHMKPRFQLKEDTYDRWVLFAVEEGRFAYGIKDEEGTAAFGDLVLCPPGAVFRREVMEPLSFHFIVLDWTDHDGRPVQTAASIPYGKMTILDIDRLSSTYTYLKKWVDIGGDFSYQLRNHLLKDLWYLYLEEANMENRSHDPDDNGRKDPLINQAIHMIRERASAPFSLKSLAGELGLTQVQFTRKFKKATGMLPIDFLTSLRLQKVQKLLLESDLSLRQIADRCGFENEFYLSRVFKKRKKVSPKQFRSMRRL